MTFAYQEGKSTGSNSSGDVCIYPLEKGLRYQWVVKWNKGRAPGGKEARRLTGERLGMVRG